MEDGILLKVYSQYSVELEELAKIRKEAFEKAEQGDSVGDYIQKIDDYTEKIKNENILTYCWIGS